MLTRPICLIALVALLCTGCSFWIADRGIELRPLTNREQVRASMGTPVTSAREGQAEYDEFHSRKKYSEPRRAAFLGLAYCYSIGFAELLNSPAEWGLLGRQVILGQDLRFYYDSAGNVTQITIDGREYYGIGYPREH